MASVWDLDPSPNSPVSTGVWIGVGGSCSLRRKSVQSSFCSRGSETENPEVTLPERRSGLGCLPEGFLLPGAAPGRKGVVPVCIRRLLAVWSGEASGYVKLHSIYLVSS